MNNAPLITKYRPITFEEVLGHDAQVKSLRLALSGNSIPHAFLLTGPAGTGKTTLARIIAKELDASLTEIDGSLQGGIDAIKQLVESTVFKPLTGKDRHMYIIDECHGLTKQAWVPLQKLLEDPPEYLYFALCTTEIAKINDAINTRCHPVRLKALSSREIESLLETVTELEGWKVNNDVFNGIVQAAEGSARKALSILQAGYAAADRNELSQIVMKVDSDDDPARELCMFLLKGGRSWKAISQILSKIEDEETAILLITRYLAGSMARSDESQAKEIWIMLEKFMSYSTYDKKVQLYSALGRILWGTIPF